MPAPLPGIRHVIAVASGKGGVGKSTVAANLAVALTRRGLRCGIADVDVLGPSIPALFGAPYGVKPEQTGGKLVPTERHGVSLMSMGFVTGHDAPAILRSPMVNKYMRMFVEQVAWPELDLLLLDLPPGTGDVQITMAQRVPLTGAVIVTTPQDVSLNIARRGLRMFQKVRVPILGLVENMSGFTCPHCEQVTDVFRSGGGERMSVELGIDNLGRIPLDVKLVAGGDMGRPILELDGDSPAAHAYEAVARAVHDKLPEDAGAPEAEIDWNLGEASLDIRFADGEEAALPFRRLRLSCRFALCVEEETGRRILVAESVPEDVHITSIDPVGRYALRLSFSDGHETGIYNFDLLKRIAHGEDVDLPPPKTLDEPAFRAEVERVLTEEINPSVASHGGRIVLRSAAAGRVELAMEGGCQGCRAAPITLKQGVEVRLRRALPSIREIVDVTDHAAGTTPFQGAKQTPISPLT